MLVAAAQNEFCSGTEAIRIAGLSWSRLRRLVVVKKIRVLLEPGLAPMYSREDLEALKPEDKSRRC